MRIACGSPPTHFARHDEIGSRRDQLHSTPMRSRRNTPVKHLVEAATPSRQVRMFRDLFLITELLDSKAESDDVGLERSWLGCPVRSSGLSGLLKSSKKPPLIHQTEARLIRRYSGYLGRGRTHAAKAH
jgi:hypothetical protein